MALHNRVRRNYGGKSPVSIRYQNFHSFKEGMILLCQSIFETRRITHLHGSALFTIPLRALLIIGSVFVAVWYEKKDLFPQRHRKTEAHPRLQQISKIECFIIIVHRYSKALHLRCLRWASINLCETYSWKFLLNVAKYQWNISEISSL